MNIKDFKVGQEVFMFASEQDIYDYKLDLIQTVLKHTTSNRLYDLNLETLRELARILTPEK